MIAEFQDIIKNIVLEATEIQEDFIYLTAIGDNEYNTPPWASILPDLAFLTPAWHWDNACDTGKNFVKVQRKWDVVQPMLIHLGTVERETVSRYMAKILELLPWRIPVSGGFTEWNVVQTEHIFAAGELDIYAGIITLNIEYAVRWDAATQKRMENIDININNVNK
ncbi:hypothetical protein SAMN02745150_01436 [Brevinema andersonii]|uniref:Uncharacterized protein n=1 Tax=Brevinema andersonii TaxID=34097 RepID=A0A1I1FF35_BREAD|nr:hypothetical protein [Brevinema andersonii]SFB95733.1 hypothetical protein SAMN02745150_01436 [Brevinema andersonii]